ncbi:MAG: M23 family metallopeptidase [Deltaproteobacteria bacterium]|nr:MAG: M23 family metallopeptidase [Deltaproteobacteria bacterium]
MMKPVREASVISYTVSIAFLLILLLSSCWAPYGIYHTVKTGQTFYRICKTYGVSEREVARLNDIDDPTQIMVGQKIFIPGASMELVVEVVKPGVVASPGVSKDIYEKKSETPKKSKEVKFIWPVDGVVYSKFGWREGNHHDGIDISAPEGTPIKAVEAGKVIYSNSLKGYGKLIIIKHEGHYSTVYAHNQANSVKEGDFVEKGQVIGRVGRTGKASGYHLHFEVRRNKKPVDPLPLLFK